MGGKNKKIWFFSFFLNSESNQWGILGQYPQFQAFILISSASLDKSNFAGRVVSLTFSPPGGHHEVVWRHHKGFPFTCVTLYDDCVKSNTLCFPLRNKCLKPNVSGLPRLALKPLLKGTSTGTSNSPTRKGLRWLRIIALIYINTPAWLVPILGRACWFVWVFFTSSSYSMCCVCQVTGVGVHWNHLVRISHRLYGHSACGQTA